MKRFIVKLAILCTLVKISSTAEAGTETDTAEITQISPEDQSVSLTSFSYFSTPEKLDIENIALRQSEFPWQHKDGFTLNSGINYHNIFWYRFSLRNVGSAAIDRIIFLNTVFVEDLEVVILQKGTISSHYKGGTYVANRSRPVDHRNFLFPISLPPNADIEVIIKQSTLIPRFSIQIW
ncbi:MAG: hypothetical protein HQK54_08685, partial [Oligoflexales bacterium]|nr:hypothetical protein [Oligoflexales bacterium]